MRKHGITKWIFLGLILLPLGSICAQTPPASASNQPSTGNSAPVPTIMLPAGTRILVTLKNPLHTTSAEANSGVYSETASVVVQDNRVVIPLKTQVQGVVQSLPSTATVSPNGVEVTCTCPSRSYLAIIVRPSESAGTLTV